MCTDDKEASPSASGERAASDRRGIGGDHSVISGIDTIPGIPRRRRTGCEVLGVSALACRWLE